MDDKFNKEMMINKQPYLCYDKHGKKANDTLTFQ